MLALAAFSLAALVTAQTTGQIHPAGHGDKCLDVQGANFAQGTPVQIYDCNGTPAQQWTYWPSNPATQVTAGNGWCLAYDGDASTDPGTLNGRKMVLKWCMPRASTAQFVVVQDEGGFKLQLISPDTVVLDLTDGNTDNGNQVQVWTAYPGNPNQVWSA